MIWSINDLLTSELFSVVLSKKSKLWARQQMVGSCHWVDLASAVAWPRASGNVTKSSPSNPGSSVTSGGFQSHTLPSVELKEADHPRASAVMITLPSQSQSPRPRAGQPLTAGPACLPATGWRPCPPYPKLPAVPQVEHNSTRAWNECQVAGFSPSLFLHNFISKSVSHS